MACVVEERENHMETLLIGGSARYMDVQSLIIIIIVYIDKWQPIWPYDIIYSQKDHVKWIYQARPRSDRIASDPDLTLVLRYKIWIYPDPSLDRSFLHL